MVAPNGWRRVVPGWPRLERHLPIALFVVAGLDVLVWFQGHLPVGAGDGGLLWFGYHAQFALGAYLHAWNPYANLGQPTGSNVALITWLVPFAVATRAGLPGWVSQALWFWGIQVASMLFMYHFLKGWLEQERYKCIAATVGAFFYNFMPIVVVNYWFRMDLNLVILPFAPAALIWVGRLPHANVRWIATRGAALLFFGSSLFLDSAYILPIAGLGAARLLFSLHGEWKGRAALQQARTILIGTVVATCANSWYLVPVVESLRSTYQAAAAQENPLVTLFAASSEVSPFGLAQFQALNASAPAWAFRDPSWRALYGSPLLVAVGTSLFVIAVLGMLHWKSVRGAAYFSVLWIAGILLSLGVSGPTGSAYFWAFEHIPFFGALRNPVNKFGIWIAVGGSGLVAIASLSLCNWLCWWKRHGREVWVGAALSIGMVLVYGFPMLTGGAVDGVIRIAGRPAPTTTVQVPGYYNTVATYLRENEASGGLATLPLSQTTYVTMAWRHGYDGADLQWLILERQAVAYTTGGTTPLGQYLERLEAQGTSALAEGLGRLGVKYVLLEGDVRGVGPGPRTTPTVSTRQYEAALRASGGTVVLRAGALVLMRLPNRAIAPMVTLSVGDGGRSGGLNLVDRSTPLRSVRSSSLSSGGVMVRLPRGWSGGLLTVHNSFASGWVATDVESGGTGGKGGSEESLRHVIVDGVLNGWVVPPSETGERATVYVNYQPQTVASDAAVASLMAVIGLVVWEAVCRLWAPVRRHSNGRLL